LSTISHPPSGAVGEQGRFWWLSVTEMWASLAIVSMWLAVLFDAVFGPNIVSNTPGGESTSVPSAVVVALFASLGTWAVARYGFGQHRKRDRVW
jgi:hypothetical protein